MEMEMGGYALEPLAALQSLMIKQHPMLPSTEVH